MSNSFPKPLSDKEEEYYLSLYEQGDTDAKNILVERNLRLVAHIVKKYASTGYNADDLISIGAIGLIKAVNTYSSKKAARLATYAAKCIENEILMSIRTNKKNKVEVSLNEPLGTDKDGNEISFNDILGTDADAILDDIHHKIQVAHLYDAVFSQLTTRERAVIVNRYGMCGHEPMTQRELAKNLGISRSYSAVIIGIKLVIAEAVLILSLFFTLTQPQPQIYTQGRNNADDKNHSNNEGKSLNFEPAPDTATALLQGGRYLILSGHNRRNAPSLLIKFHEKYETPTSLTPRERTRKKSPTLWRWCCAPMM